MTRKSDTFVLFIPGLKGSKSLHLGTPETPVPESNQGAVHRAAKENKTDFFAPGYQSLTNSYPFLSEMGDTVANHLKTLQQTYDRRGLVIASSVGAGVLLQALNQSASYYPLPDVILIKPVYDPLSSIEGYMGTTDHGKTALAALKGRKIERIPLPISGSDTQKNAQSGDSFMLTRTHLEDPRALRLSNNWETATKNLEGKLSGRKIPNMKILLAGDDPFSPLNLSREFSKHAKYRLARDLQEPICFAGNHGAPIHEHVGTATDIALKSGWGRGERWNTSPL